MKSKEKAFVSTARMVQEQLNTAIKTRSKHLSIPADIISEKKILIAKITTLQQQQIDAIQRKANVDFSRATQDIIQGLESLGQKISKLAKPNKELNELYQELQLHGEMLKKDTEKLKQREDKSTAAETSSDDENSSPNSSSRSVSNSESYSTSEVEKPATKCAIM